jgi:hypothetical protein
VPAQLVAGRRRRCQFPTAGLVLAEPELTEQSSNNKFDNTRVKFA